jgi:hypothetical protein
LRVQVGCVPETRFVRIAASACPTIPPTPRPATCARGAASITATSRTRQEQQLSAMHRIFLDALLRKDLLFRI